MAYGEISSYPPFLHLPPPHSTTIAFSPFLRNPGAARRGEGGRGSLIKKADDAPGGETERRAAVVVAHGPEHKKVVSLYPIIQGWAELNGFPLLLLLERGEGRGCNINTGISSTIIFSPPPPLRGETDNFLRFPCSFPHSLSLS